MSKIYTGIGSRDTPEEIIFLMKKLGFLLAKKNFILRSGGAKGADYAFEQGCDLAGGKKEIFVPWKGFGKKHGRNPLETDISFIPDLAKKAFRELLEVYQDFNINSEKYIWALMERNMCQIMGSDMKTPTSGVICWTPNGEEVGGTRWAIRFAKKNNIRIYNLAEEKEREKIESLVKEVSLPESDR